ncbi:MAG TPA: DUF3237 domain-containing protein [Acidimicrobiales bacterium]|nr:DUF3237 domain-containing protein [Acidimicrobiales bacterium]
MPLELIPLCEIDMTLRQPIFVGNGPRGLRLVIEVEDSTVSGDRIRGQMLGTATADWVTIVDNVGTVDVRSTFETDDGAVVFCQYSGRINFTNGPGTAPVYNAPTFETGDERYRWLNFVQAVGVGTMDETATALHYEWYELRAT